MFEEICAAAKVEILQWGGLSLIRAADLERVLDVCALRGVVVLGFDGFEFESGELRSRDDVIGDYSGASSAESIESARVVAATFDPRLLIELTI